LIAAVQLAPGGVDVRPSENPFREVRQEADASRSVSYIDGGTRRLLFLGRLSMKVTVHYDVDAGRPRNQRVTDLPLVAEGIVEPAERHPCSSPTGWSPSRPRRPPRRQRLRGSSTISSTGPVAPPIASGLNVRSALRRSTPRTARRHRQLGDHVGVVRPADAMLDDGSESCS